MTQNPFENQVFETASVPAGVVMPAAKLDPLPMKIGRQTLNARYELAERSVDNNEHFARAQGGSALQNQSGVDRATLRDRIRHEMHEADPWLHGSQRTTVVSTIGRGAWLEVNIAGTPEVSRDISSKFNQWFRDRVGGPRKLRTMCWSQGSDGPGLAVIVTNYDVRGPVKLDFVPFEDEQIKANPASRNTIDRRNYLLDGVEQDNYGNPSRYWITEKHPDEYPESESRPIDAQYVIDVFDKQRPSQGRGVSDYATSVRNGPLRRIYRRATLDAAATAAKMSYILESNVDRFEDGENNFEDIDSLTGLPIYYGEGTVLPKGWKAMQMKAEQPTTGHTEFMRGNVAEMGRSAGQPAMVALGDATGLNFASGQLSRADWAEDVDVRRQDWETLCLDKLLAHWLREAALVGEIPLEYADIDNVPHEYRWTRRRHQDTNKEYSGRAKAIASGQTSRAFWMTDDGVNPDSEDEAAAVGFGVDKETYRRALFLQTFGDAAFAALGLPIPGKGLPPEDSNDDDQQTETDDDDSENPETPDSERSNGKNGRDLDAYFARNGGTGGQYNR